MENVMQNAWSIAKQGQNKFGGSTKEYFAEALKMAWKIIKNGVAKMKAVLKILSGSKKHKSWVAQLTGSNDTYKFNRNFVNDYETEEGMYGDRIYNLDNGVYDVCDGGQRKYIVVTNGEIEEIEENEVSSHLA